MGFKLGDQVLVNINGKSVKAEYLDGNKKKSNVLTINGNEVVVSTKKIKLLF